jgi:hypothetical protein
VTVERLKEHSLEDCLGEAESYSIYIIGGWDCLGFNGVTKTRTILKPTAFHIGRKRAPNAQAAAFVYISSESRITQKLLRNKR